MTLPNSPHIAFAIYKVSVVVVYETLDVPDIGDEDSMKVLQC